MQKIFLHIPNGSEIPLMSILKLFFDNFDSFLKREVIILSLRIGNIVVLDLLKIIQRKKKMEKMNR